MLIVRKLNMVLHSPAPKSPMYSPCKDPCWILTDLKNSHNSTLAPCWVRKKKTGSQVKFTATLALVLQLEFRAIIIYMILSAVRGAIKHGGVSSNASCYLCWCTFCALNVACCWPLLHAPDLPPPHTTCDSWLVQVSVHVGGHEPVKASIRCNYSTFLKLMLLLYHQPRTPSHFHRHLFASTNRTQKPKHTISVLTQVYISDNKRKMSTVGCYGVVAQFRVE